VDLPRHHLRRFRKSPRRWSQTPESPRPRGDTTPGWESIPYIFAYSVVFAQHQLSEMHAICTPPSHSTAPPSHGRGCSRTLGIAGLYAVCRPQREARRGVELLPTSWCRYRNPAPQLAERKAFNVRYVRSGFRCTWCWLPPVSTGCAANRACWR
jgi:hypothetical protein